MSAPKVTLELSQDEALVFFEWLSKLNATEGRQFNDEAEQRVLWDLEAMLESTLVAPFCADYDALLAKARAAVRGEKLSEYVAIIWPRDAPERPGQRVTILAASLDDARRRLLEEHGEGTVLDLHIEEDIRRR